MKKVILFILVILFIAGCSSIGKVKCDDTTVAKGMLKRIFVYSEVHYQENGLYPSSIVFNQNASQEWVEVENDPGEFLSRPNDKLLYEYSLISDGKSIVAYADPSNSIDEKLRSNKIIKIDTNGTITEVDNKE